MGRLVKLVCVSELNNNKYYNMEDLEDGTFKATWGRVGGNEYSKIYPISKWDSTYRSKKKDRPGKPGYTDVTDYQTTVETEFVDVDDPVVARLIQQLNDYSRKKMLSTYTVAASAVTQMQLDDAQDILNQIADRLREIGYEDLNKMLLRLYTIIPRAMSDVRLHIFQDQEDVGRKGERIVTDEQDNLDTMGTQVTLSQAPTAENDKQTILDTLGIEVVHYDKPLPLPNNYLEPTYDKVFKVINRKTEERFKKWLDSSELKNTGLFWHGSRDENFLSILANGLMVRPTGVSTCGSNFGNGIYLADDYRKSRQYTGRYLAVFEAHVGKQYHANWRDHRLSLNRIGDCHSVLGKTDYHEYIFYRPEQVTVRFLLDLK